MVVISYRMAENIIDMVTYAYDRKAIIGFSGISNDMDDIAGPIAFTWCEDVIDIGYRVI